MLSDFVLGLEQVDLSTYMLRGLLTEVGDCLFGVGTVVTQD